MPHYKLTYFDIRGLGEFIRMTFIEAGVPFEDNRIPMGNTDWKEGTQTLFLGLES